MNAINRGLLVFEFDDISRIQSISFLPTACLLVADKIPPLLDINELVMALISSGCSHFMTWGGAANELHDVIDHILEDSEKSDAITAVTTSHRDEDMEEVAWFLVNATHPGEETLRCCIGYSSNIDSMVELLECVKKEIEGGA